MTFDRLDTVVLKIGGSAIMGVCSNWWDGVAEIARERPVLCVHGWSRPLERFRAERGRESVMLRDKHGHRSRLTDESVLDDIVVVSETLRDAIERALGERNLDTRGVVAADEMLLEAQVKPNLWWVGRELRPLPNLVGPISRVDADRIAILLADVQVLVLTPLATSAEHRLVNVDGDRAAAEIAAALGTRELIVTTDVPGVTYQGSTMHSVDSSELPQLQKEANHGMIKKLRAVEDALMGGVERVAIGNAPPSELLDGKVGTQVTST